MLRVPVGLRGRNVGNTNVDRVPVGFCGVGFKFDLVLLWFGFEDLMPFRVREFRGKMGQCIVLAGTKSLMAQEVPLLVEVPCCKCDLWSAACTLHAAVFGEMPSWCLPCVENGFPAAFALGHKIMDESQQI